VCRKDKKLEKWLEIEEFPKYEVSSEGRVRNRDSGRILDTAAHPINDMLMVGVSKHGKQYKRSVHKLVALAFLGDPPPYSNHTPIHLDGDVTNNSEVNLEWRELGDAREWMKDWRRIKPLFNRRLSYVDIRSGEVTIFENSREAARAVNGLETRIVTAARNKLGYKKGYWSIIWDRG
jgi:hypothetical protein